MRPIVHISVWVLTLCMMFISSLDAGRFILLDENGNPIEGEPTCSVVKTIWQTVLVDFFVLVAVRKKKSRTSKFIQ